MKVNNNNVFFKTFSIKKKYYTVVNLGDLDNNYQEVCADTKKQLFDEYSFHFDEYIEHIKDFKDYKKKYPIITAEIREKLIHIIVEKYGDFTYSTFDNPISNSNTYQAMCDFEWEDWNIKSDDSNGFDNALYSLCIKLQPEIQNEVSELFK